MKKRVKIPKQNAKALLDLVTKVRAKHVADGDASPLKVLNWQEINGVIDEALQADEAALHRKRETLNLYQQRAQALEAVARIVRSSRDILSGVHSDQIKILGLWGFDVLDGRVTIASDREVNETVAAA